MNLFSHRPYWAERFGVAPFLPTSRAEMDVLGWDSCDVILVTGDAYVDHPAFGMALVGRLLEAQGFRVGILAQPDWRDTEDFEALGPPNLFFGVTAGNMDSLVNRYTSDRKPRSQDAYSPDGASDRRPERATLVYCQRCRQAYPGVALVIGGIEASLRRVAHYDYWSDRVRRSILIDSGADLLVYGNGERQVVEIAHRLGRGESIDSIRGLRGTATRVSGLPEGYLELDHQDVDAPAAPGEGLLTLRRKAVRHARERTVLRLPGFEAIKRDPVLYAQASRLLHAEANPHNARALVQRHGETDVWINPPALPLSSEEMDRVYELPYRRVPHPSYGSARIAAYEMIRFSITIQRGCFGGCSFCSITEHEGRIIQSRSADSVLREVERVRDTVPGFTGVISDLGGPTANMYRLACKSRRIEAACRRPSCVYPDVCDNLGTDHGPLIDLYRRARELPGIDRVLIASGVRYDLAVRSPAYVRELVSHHVGGYLKIAPEHVSEGPLSHMMKPGVASYRRFAELFERFSREAGKEQYLIPYFIAAHPGTRDEDMLELALWLKKSGFRPDQVQTFLPSPMATATAMYHARKNPLRRLRRDGGDVIVPRGPRARRLHKAFLRYHDPDNWPVLRAALQRMGRRDLIGYGKRCLVPPRQPAGWKPPPGAGGARARPKAARAQGRSRLRRRESR